MLGRQDVFVRSCTSSPIPALKSSAPTSQLGLHTVMRSSGVSMCCGGQRRHPVHVPAAGAAGGLGKSSTEPALGGKERLREEARRVRLAVCVS